MYRVYSVSLAAAAGETVLVDESSRITEIAILSVPDGGEIQLRIGNNADWIAVTKAVTFAPDNDNDADHGIRYRVVNVLAGAAVQIIVSFGGTMKTVLL